MVSIGCTQRKSPESSSSLPSLGCTASRASAAPSVLRRAPSSSASAPSICSEAMARATVSGGGGESALASTTCGGPRRSEPISRHSSSSGVRSISGSAYLR